MCLVNQIKNDPIFSMSLSSKELFHSNFWAWLFERNIAYAKIFFPELICIKSIEREQKHRDITIWQSGNIRREKKYFDDAFIIENKFKSIPQKDQLKRYQKELEKKYSFKKGLLTGIIAPDFLNDEDLKDWYFMSYNEIGIQIKKVAETIEKDSFEKELIIKYAEMICNLYKLLIESLNNKKECWLTENETFTELRIEDIYGKLIASNFINYFKNNLNLEQEINGYSLYIFQDFYNSPLVSIRYTKGNSKTSFAIGIEIQDKQYRWYVQRDYIIKRNSQAINEFYNEFLNKGWFVEYDKSKIIKDHITDAYYETSLSKLFDCYSTDKYTFIYQYRNIISGQDKFKDICTIVQRDMEKAAEIIKSL